MPNCYQNFSVLPKFQIFANNSEFQDLVNISQYPKHESCPNFRAFPKFCPNFGVVPKFRIFAKIEEFQDLYKSVSVPGINID